MCLGEKPAWIMVGAPAPHAFQVLSVPIYIEITALPVLARPVVLFPSSPLCVAFPFEALARGPRPSFVLFFYPPPVQSSLQHGTATGTWKLARPIPPVTYIRQAVAIISGAVHPLNTSACLARVVHSRLAAPSGDPCPAAHTRSSRGRDAPCIRLLLADQGPHTRRSRRPHPSVPSLPLLQSLFFSRTESRTASCLRLHTRFPSGIILSHT